MVWIAFPIFVGVLGFLFLLPILLMNLSLIIGWYFVSSFLALSCSFVAETRGGRSAVILFGEIFCFFRIGVFLCKLFLIRFTSFLLS